MNLDGREFPIYFANEDQSVCYKLTSKTSYEKVASQKNGAFKNFQFYVASETIEELCLMVTIDYTECDAIVFETLVSRVKNNLPQ